MVSVLIQFFSTYFLDMYIVYWHFYFWDFCITRDQRDESKLYFVKFLNSGGSLILLTHISPLHIIEGHLWEPRQTERKPNNKGNKELTK